MVFIPISIPHKVEFTEADTASAIDKFQLKNDWVDAIKFNNKGNIADETGKPLQTNYSGRQYQLIAKKQRHFNGIELACRIALGAFLTIFSFTYAYRYNFIKNLFKAKENIRFGILIPEETVSAATTLQAFIRAHSISKNLLPPEMYDNYSHACKNKKKAPRAQEGDTAVYLPKEMPEVVLKESGRTQAIERFHQMQEVRSIVESQNSTHLIIPRANLYKKFLVEDRLPINVDCYHNMGLYFFQSQLFDEAICELVRLFSKGYIGDLVNSQAHPLSRIEGAGDFVRYDNLPLYITEEGGKQKGKIGLIDLEHFKDSPEPEGLETLAKIFPLHLNIIKEEAQKLGMVINKKSVDAAAEKGIKYLNVGFLDHFKWLEKKGVLSDIPFKNLFHITSERKLQLTNVVKNELLVLNNGTNDLFPRKNMKQEPARDFLKVDSEAAKELSEILTPRILSNIKKELNSYLLEDKSERELSIYEMVSLRSPYIKRETLHEEVGQEVAKLINAQKFPYWQYNYIAEQLTHVIIQDLLKNGELFSYTPEYGNHESCWIRF